MALEGRRLDKLEEVEELRLSEEILIQVMDLDIMEEQEEQVLLTQSPVQQLLMLEEEVEEHKQTFMQILEDLVELVVVAVGVLQGPWRHSSS